MPSSGMWRRADLLRTDVEDERKDMFFRNVGTYIPKDGILHGKKLKNLRFS
jgi:hypothetical protein